jgi:hypothetical protein
MSSDEGQWGAALDVVKGNVQPNSSPSGPYLSLHLDNIIMARQRGSIVAVSRVMDGRLCKS